MSGFRGAAALVLVVWVCVGCSARITGGLDEARANEVVAALERAGIATTKQAESGGAEPTFAVEVARDELGRALTLLQESSLPRRADPGIAETYAEPSLVPSANEERARYHAAIAGELAATLERLDGVVDARVHLAMPETRELALDGSRPPSRASVLLKTRHATRLDPDGVRALVAGAVDGLETSAVSVVVVSGGADPARAGSLARVGPFRVARGSASPLTATLVASIFIHIATAGVLVLLVRRGRRATGGPEPT